jgi:hypothetical protein
MCFRKIRIFILSIFLLAVPVLGQTVVVETDKFTSRENLSCFLGAETPGTFFNPQGVVGMTIYAFPNPINPTYNLVVTLDRKNWLFIQPGASLVLKIDGEMLSLNTKRGSLDNRRVGSPWISEIAWYDFTYENLVKISSAQKIEYRLMGSRGYIDYRFEEKAIRGFQSLLALLPKNGSPWKIVGNIVSEDKSMSEAKKDISSSESIPRFDLTAELVRFDKLKKDGLITAEDYEVLKKRAIEKAMK